MSMMVSPHRFAAASTGDTVPTFSNVLLLSGFGGPSFVDESSFARTMTAVGNAQISTAQSKFGGSSGAFDGTGDWVTMASDAAFNFGYSAFTIDCFFRLNSTSGLQGLVTKIRLLGSNATWYLYVNAGKLAAAISTGTQPTTQIASNGCLLAPSTPTLSANQWYHARVDRTAANPTTGGSTMRLYLDGVMIAKEATAGSGSGSNINIKPTSTSQIWLGGINNNSGEWPLNGYLDEVRVVTGQALCASDSGFTVPASAYPRS